MVNLKSASFVVIMLLHEGLTPTHSQIKPGLLFGKSILVAKPKQTLNLKKIKLTFDCLFVEIFNRLENHLVNQGPTLVF